MSQRRSNMFCSVREMICRRLIIEPSLTVGLLPRFSTREKAIEYVLLGKGDDLPPFDY